MRRYETVILGSGHFALGYAAVRSDTLIVERSYLADAELSGTLGGYMLAGYAPISNEAKELFEFYRECGIACEVALDSPLLEVGASAFAKARGIRYLFGTECTDIKKTDEGYEVSLFGNAGFETVFAKRLIDSRPTERSILRILLRGDRSLAEEIELSVASTEVTDAFYDGECVLCCRLSNITNANAAKATILRELEEKLPRALRVVQVAPFLGAEDKCALRRFDEGALSAKESLI